MTETFLDLLKYLANHNLDTAMGQMETERYPGFLSVHHDFSSNNPMNFSVLTGVSGDCKSQYPPHGSANSSRPSEIIKILDEDNEDLVAQLQRYTENMACKMYQEEQSVFMKPTLALASQLSLRKDVSGVTRIRVLHFDGS